MNRIAIAIHLHIKTLCTICLHVVLSVYVCASFLLQKAVITNVSPDILYLFRVQAVCQHDLRSDFSQTLLFRGTWSKPLQPLCSFKLFLPARHMKMLTWSFVFQQIQQEYLRGLVL